METAQGPFSTLEPQQLTTQLGLPGLATISQGGSNPSFGADHTAYAQLTSYADELQQEQALTEAIKASRTDMLAAVPAQNYISDTRSTKWTLTNSQLGLATQGETSAYLSSSQCVDIATTRVSGSVEITFPAGGAAGAGKYFILPELFPLMLFTSGLQIGQNGNVLQDPGTATDQCWLTQMRAAKRPFNNSDLIYHSMVMIKPDGTRYPLTRDGRGFSFMNEPNDYAAPATVSSGLVVPMADGAPTVVQATFTFRPTHHFFGTAKTWPPNIPLRLILKWNPSVTSLLYSGIGDAAVQTAAANASTAIAIHTTRSNEIWLTPSVRTFIMNHFEVGPLTNMTTAQARVFQRSALYDPTYGIPAVNIADIGGIWQFETFRLSSHAVSGNQFQFHPVLNGSARPKIMVIGIPNQYLKYGASLQPAADCALQTLQVLYNGTTIWDEPYTLNSGIGGNMETLYAESARFARAENNISRERPWWNYEKWAADHAWIVVNIAPSHNPDEIQPNSAAPVEVRGTFTAPAPLNMVIRVGLFFDQTMLLRKDNTAIFSLPIY